MVALEQNFCIGTMYSVKVVKCMHASHNLAFPYFVAVRQPDDHGELNGTYCFVAISLATAARFCGKWHMQSAHMLSISVSDTVMFHRHSAIDTVPAACCLRATCLSQGMLMRKVQATNVQPTP